MDDYNALAEELAERYESVSFETVHARNQWTGVTR